MYFSQFYVKIPHLYSLNTVRYIFLVKNVKQLKIFILTILNIK